MSNTFHHKEQQRKNDALIQEHKKLQDYIIKSHQGLQEYLVDSTSTALPLTSSIAPAFKVIGWYANYRTYQADYQPENIPKNIDQVNYAFFQIGNCKQDPDTVDKQWSDYKSTGTVTCNQDLNAYATGKFDLQIYSTDPYSDLLKWPANDIGYYGKLVPGSTIPGNLPSYWPNLRDDISFNSVWSYQAPYKAWDAKGNLLKVAKLGKDMVLSIGGWSGSVQLLEAMKKEAELKGFSSDNYPYKFLTKFLPAAIPSTCNEKQWGVFPPFNPDNICQENKDFVKNNITGIDIDLEPYSNHWSKMSEKEIGYFVNFITQLKIYAPGVKLSISISGDPTTVSKINSVQKNLIQSLSEKVDQINLMTYDYNGVWSEFTAPHSALFCDPRAPKELEGAGIFNIHSAVKAWIDAGVNPKKLIIGAAAYGREVSGVSPNDEGSYLYAKFNGTGSTPLYYNPNMGQSIITQLGHNLIIGGDGPDYNYGFAYAYDTDTKSFVSYDSTASVTLKSCYAAYMQLGGVMLWDMGADTGNQLVNELMRVRDDVEGICFGNFSFDKIKGLIDDSEECSQSFAE